MSVPTKPISENGPAATVLAATQLDEVKLGATANILSGLDSSWDPSTGNANLIRFPTHAALSTAIVPPIAQTGRWNDMEVTIHDSAADLLNALVPFGVHNPSSEGIAINFLAGGLLLGPKDSTNAQSALENTLGVPLGSNHGYAFARFRRVDGDRVHNSRSDGILRSQANLRNAIGTDQEFEDDLRALPHFQGLPLAEQMASLTVEDANMYLNFFKKWGTHYVSRVQLGDQIIQVFAYSREKFEEMKQILMASSHGTTLTGGDARAFAQFTSDANKGRFGFVSHYGKLMSTSNDSAFADSLSNAQWAENLFSEGQTSIFEAYSVSSKVPFFAFNQTFRNQGILHTEVSPLTVFCEYERAEIWRRLIKAASVTVFLDGINANFTHLDTRNFTSILPDDQPGAVSTLPTPTINIYKTRLDLAGVQLVSADQVENFTGFAYALSVKRNGGPILIPGDRVQIFGGVIDARSTQNANVVKVTDVAFDNMNISCNAFLGTLRVESAVEKKYTIFSDGLQYALDSNGLPTVVGDIRQPTILPEETLLSLLDNFYFALTFGDAVLGAQQNIEGSAEPAIYGVVRNYLSWVSKVIPPTTENEELLEIRVRALVLGSYRADGNIGAHVPILPSSAYETFINRMMELASNINKSIADASNAIALRKTQELIIDTSQTLNENIIETGNLLAGFVNASASEQADIAAFHANVIEQQKAEAASQQVAVDQLKIEIGLAQTEFEIASQVLQTAIEQFQVASSIKAALGIATSIFSLTTKVSIPADEISSVKELGRSAQRVQKTFDVLNELQNLYDEAVTGTVPIRNAQSALDGLEGGSFGDVSLLPWDDMQLQFDNVMGRIPLEAVLAGPKADAILAFKSLVLRGKALTTAQAGLRDIQSTIYENQRQRELNIAQQERLDALTSQFNTTNVDNLDTSSIDLLGMTAMLNYRRDQVLASLSGAFLIRDQALQYETLQTPTLISSYSLLNFMQARSDQEGKAIAARSVLAAFQPTETAPILVTVPNVPVSAVTNREKKRITVSPTLPQFSDFVFVRVKAVVLSVDGVEKTDSGKFSVRLLFDEAPFVDRDLDGNVITFHTPQRERIYEYDLDGTRLFTDNGTTWSQGVSPVTPFGAWYVDFPDLTANAGLSFQSTTISINLSFVLETRIRAPVRLARDANAPTVASSLSAATSTPQSLVTAPEFRSLAAVPQRSLAIVPNFLQPSDSEVIATLNSAGTVTNGWDVVFNMAVEPINAALQDQFNDLKNDADFNNRIEAETQTLISDEITYSLALTDTKYGTPLMVDVSQFLPIVHLPISDGFLTQTTQLGTSEPQQSSTDITTLVLAASINPDFATDGSSLLDFDLGKGSFSWANIQPSNGTYVLNGLVVEESNMDFLFEEIRSFFATNEIKLRVPASAVTTGDYDAMNTTVAQQYQDVILQLPVKNGILASTIQTSPATLSITRLELEYSFPLMRFDAQNSEEANVSMTILSGTATKFVKIGDEPEQQSGAPESLANSNLDASVQLKRVQGKAENNNDELRVVLDLGEGAFSLSKLQLTPVQNLSLAQQIKAHFVQQGTTFLINKLDLTEASVGSALLPNGFLIKLLVTPSGAELLQLYIQTGQRALRDFTQTFLNNAPEPLPLGSTCSIIVRSELFVNDILAPGIEQFVVESEEVNPGAVSTATKLRFTSATVTASTSGLLSDLSTSSSSLDGTRTVRTYRVEGEQINWNLGGNGSDAMALSPQNDGALRLQGDKEQRLTIVERTTTRGPFVNSTSTREFETRVTPIVNGFMRMNIGGSGRDQTVTTSMTAQSMDIEGRVSGGGACGGDDLEAKVNKLLRDNVPDKIVGQLNFDIPPVSTFAIKNLLFHKNNIINLETAAAPGDLVVFGNFIED